MCVEGWGVLGWGECYYYSFERDDNSFPVSGNFFHLLITFANSLDPDQADLDPNCLTF